MKINYYVLLPFLLVTSTTFSQGSSINLKDVTPPESTSITTQIQNRFREFYDDEIQNINTEISRLQNAMDNVTSETDLDSINNLIKIQIKSKKKLERQSIRKISSFNYNWFLPTKNIEQRDKFFAELYNKDSDNTKYLNSLAINTNFDGASAQSELITDKLNWFRVSFGSVIAAQNEAEESDSPDEETSGEKETQEEAFTRLINGGGNFYLSFELPLITTYNGNSNDIMIGYLFFQMKAASDIKGFGNNIETTTANGSFGFNGYIGASSENKNFNFFLQANLDYSFGTKDFYSNLGITNERGFLNGKLITGLTFLQKFRLSAVVSAFGSEKSIRNEKIAVGLQILP